MLGHFTPQERRVPPRIAVLVPCLDEEATIGRVVQSFQDSLPGAIVYVCDNGSSDATVQRAREAGAVVRTEPLRGKGNVVRRLFADVEADVYVLVDGDETYEAAAAPSMVRRLVDEHLDMVSGARASTSTDSFRSGHRLGNRLLTGAVQLVFEDRVADMLSGFRVLSRRFVKSFPALASGFEIETELTVHALDLRMPLAEEETAYRERPAGSVSKLRTLRDGWVILRTILLLWKEYKPVQCFGTLFVLLASASVALAIPIFVTFEKTGQVPRFPTAILSTGIMLLAFFMLTAGLVLDSVARGRRELKRLAYLTVPAWGSSWAGDSTAAEPLGVPPRTHPPSRPARGESGP